LTGVAPLRSASQTAIVGSLAAAAAWGGRETNFTVCLNWYPDIGIRFMANWVSVLQLAAPFNRPNINGVHPQIFVMRAQVNW
jgi:phosphate-selective porin OprO/OprP